MSNFVHSTWRSLTFDVRGWFACSHHPSARRLRSPTKLCADTPAQNISITWASACVMRRAIIITTATIGGAAVLYSLWTRRRLTRSPPPPEPSVVAHVPRPMTAADGGNISPIFAEYLDLCKADGLQQPFVLPDRHGRPLAACTLLLEPKFLRGGTKAAHLTRWAGGGQRMRAELLRQLVDLARADGAYKAIVDAPQSEARAHNASSHTAPALTDPIANMDCMRCVCCRRARCTRVDSKSARSR